MRQPFRALAPALLTLALAWSAPADAQRFTMRTLSPPSNVLGQCELAIFAKLDDDGNVHGSCTYWTGGFYFDSSLPWTIPLPDTRNRALVWKADGSRSTSSYPWLGSADRTLGKGPDGKVLSRVIAIPVRNFNDRVQLGVYAYNGSSWAKWAAPAPLTGSWSIVRLSGSGAMLLKSDAADAPGRLAVQRAGSVTTLPPLPLGTDETVYTGWANTAGQAVVTTQRPGVVGRWFWWNGQSWAERTMGGLTLRTGIEAQWLVSLNNKGLALVTTRDDPGADTFRSAVRYQVWNPATDQLQPLPTRLSYQPQGDMNDAGVVAGENLPAQADPLEGFKNRRATIWRNGQAVDLNTLVTLPDGAYLERSLAINNRGQILAVLQSAGTQWDWVLLTPQ